MLNFRWLIKNENGRVNVYTSRPEYDCANQNMGFKRDSFYLEFSDSPVWLKKKELWLAIGKMLPHPDLKFLKEIEKTGYEEWKGYLWYRIKSDNKRCETCIHHHIFDNGARVCPVVMAFQPVYGMINCKWEESKPPENSCKTCKHFWEETNLYDCPDISGCSLTGKTSPTLGDDGCQWKKK